MEYDFQRKVSVLAVVVLLLSTAAFAQRLDGTLRGEVTDSSGAVIPDAKVTAAGVATGVSYSTQTTSTGTYVFPHLNVGDYDLTVEKKGFQKHIRRGVGVSGNKTSEAHVQLAPGAEETVIEVVAGAEMVQTESSQLTNTFSGRIVNEVPIATLGGTPLELAALAPNTTTQGGGVLGTGGSIGGARPRLNSFTIDGTDNNDVSVTGPVQPIIQDSVAEFSLLTNQFSAEYGQAGGGQFNIVTKSGGNSAHGELHWYTQNRRLNATDNLIGAAIDAGDIPGKPRYDFNRLGASMGGPIFPNKLFFYGAYEYQTLGVESTGVALDAPTSGGLGILQGLAATPQALDILNQFPTASSAGPESECVNGTGTGRALSTDPLILNCVANGGVVVPIGSLQLFAPDNFAQHDFITNVDLNLGQHTMRWRFLYDRYRSPLIADNPLPQFTGSLNVDNRKLIFTDVWVINPHWVNDFRAAYTRQVANWAVPSQFSNFPNAIIDTLGLNIGPGGNYPQSGITNIYQFSDSMTYSRGGHTFKWGFEFRNWLAPSDFLPRGRGEWDYANLTSLVNDLVPDGLNGALRGAGSGAFAGNQQGYFFFVQDDWKLTSRLTLNLGLRYELVTVSRDSGLQALNSVSDCPTCTFGGGAPGALIFGVPKRDSNNFSPRVGFAWDPTGSRKWAVRGGAGIYFDKEPQNFPLLQLPPMLQSEQNPSLTCAGSAPPAWCATGMGFLAGGGLLQFNVACNDPALVGDYDGDGDVDATDTQQACRSATQGIILDEVKPKTITWTLSVQRELWKNATFELRYLGTAGISLPVQSRANVINGFEAGLSGLPTFLNASDIPATFPLTSERRTDWTNHLTCATTCFLRFAGPGGSGDFDGGFVTMFTKNGHSTYHAASADFIQGFSRGLYLRANYTWAHAIDNATNELFSSRVNPRRPQDWNNLSGERGRSVLDIRHKMAVSWVYDVPKIQTDSGFGKAFLHGWQLNGSWLVQTGQPVTALAGTDSNGDGDSAGDRAILNPGGIAGTGSGVTAVCMDTASGASSLGTTATGGCVAGSTTVGYLANDPTAQFVQAQRGAISDVGRNSISTDGLNIVNFSFFKNTLIGENKNIQLRFEMFNVLNHRNFSLGQPSIFGFDGNALSTTFSNVTAGSDFLNNRTFNGGSRTIQLALKFIF